jgi:hypothetical protein
MRHKQSDKTDGVGIKIAEARGDSERDIARLAAVSDLAARHPSTPWGRNQSL